MRTTIQSTMKCVAMAVCVLLAACTKDVYEPEPDPVPPTPEKPEPVLPNDFNQSTATIRQVTFTVEVNDEYNGQFDYVVSLYDKNPFSVKDAKPLYTGVANRNKPLLRTVTLPQALTTIYVMQTDPRKGKSVKTLSLDPATTNLMCNFKPAPATKAETKAALRSGEDQYVPSKEAITMTMKELEDMIDWSNGNVSLSAGEYVLTEQSLVNNLNLKGEVKLFVRGKLTFSSINTDGNSTIIIEDGGELVNINADNLFANGKGSKIVIKKGGKLYKQNEINEPSIKLYGYNIENYSTILVDGISTGSDYNNLGGSPISIVNYGEIHATNILMYAGGCSIENHCLIDIKEQLYLGKGAKLSLDTQTMLKAKSLEATDMSCEMSKYSIFRIFGRSNGEGEAILKGNNTIKCKDADFALVDFNVMNLISGKLDLSGNLQLLGADLAGGQFDDNISSTGGATRVDQAGSITIPGNSTNPQGDNACTGEGNQGSTEEPSNPNFPIVTPNGSYSTFAMEDNWPAFGDYDMNDLVLGINSELSLDPSNNVTEMTLYIDLIAVGATKILGAGIQFEKLTASQVGSVTSPGVFVNNGYFDLSNGLEPNSKAVLPLFDDAHWLLSGTQQREILNTYNNSKNYYPTRKLMYVLTFNTPVSAEDLDISNQNFFIVNGGTAQKRSEVHLAGYQPTDRVKGNTNNYIATDPENPDKTMWGFIIPTEFMYAAENATINSAYPEFGAWSTSAGNQSKDWYEHPEDAHIYHQPKTE